MTEQGEDQPTPEGLEQAQHRAEIEAQAAAEIPPGAPGPGAPPGGPAGDEHHISEEESLLLSRHLVDMGLDSLQGAHPALKYSTETRERMTGAVAPVIRKYDGALPPIVLKYKEELWLLANVVALGYTSVMAVKAYDQAHAGQDAHPHAQDASQGAHPGTDPGTGTAPAPA